MPNRRRGEILLDLGGRRLTLCLTLGALAELEDAFGANGIAALGARFEHGDLSARELIRILAIAARGGGENIEDADIAALPVGHLSAYVKAVADLFTVTFGPDAPREVARPRPLRNLPIATEMG